MCGAFQCLLHAHPYPRDGRALKKEVKVRNLMSLDRFLNRTGGFHSQAADQSLVDMGLQELSPSHYHRQVMHLCIGVAVPLFMKLVLVAARLSCDFAFRFFRRAATIFEEIKEQRFRSVNLISDASPKARMDVPWIPWLKSCVRWGVVSGTDGSEVWLPILTVDKTVAPWVLQRLSDLLPSTASTETKMEECQRLADQAAQADSKLATARKLPKAISKIKQQRLSTREHLKAVIHSLELLECELHLPKATRAGARPDEHIAVDKYASWSFRCNTQSGESEQANKRHIKAEGDIEDQAATIVYQRASESCHSLELLECELHLPKATLAGARPDEHIAVDKYASWSFRCNTQSGESEWLCLDQKLLRLVLQGDQGGPLYSGYQYLAGRGFAVSFIRDESCLGFE
eukprot:s3003_g1.t1